MKVMLDTNILISAFILKSKIMNDLIELLSKNHKIFLSSYTIKELIEITETKFKVNKKYLNIFLEKFPFEIINSPKIIKDKLFDIRDQDDYVILYTAIISNMDIFITGDKDFENVKIKKPEILGVREFLEKYNKNDKY